MSTRTRNIIVAFILGLTSLGRPAFAKTLTVITTTPDLAALVLEIGGTDVHVESMVDGTQNPHFVHVKPSMIQKFSKADLFIQTGLELESAWARPLVLTSRNKKIQPGSAGFLDASLGISLLETNGDPGNVHPVGTPHYLTDPLNGLLVANVIAKKLTQLAPANAFFFENNRKSFESRLKTALAQWTHDLAPLKDAPFASYHKEWSYFAERFGLVSIGEIEPQPGVSPTAAHTAELVQQIKTNQVTMIFLDPWIDAQTGATLAKATGASILTLAVFPGALPETEDYVSTIDANVRAILKAQKR